MTGNGKLDGSARHQHQLDIRCDPSSTKKQQLKVEWRDGTGKHRFELSSLSYLFCGDDPGITPKKKPKSHETFDTLYGEGTGTFDKVSGALVSFTASDAGERGTSDYIRIEISSAGGFSHLLGGRFPRPRQPPGS